MPSRHLKSQQRAQGPPKDAYEGPDCTKRPPGGAQRNTKATKGGPKETQNPLKATKENEETLNTSKEAPI